MRSSRLPGGEWPSAGEGDKKSPRGQNGIEGFQRSNGGGGTRTPKGLRPVHFECTALPVRTTPPELFQVLCGVSYHSWMETFPRKRERPSFLLNGLLTASAQNGAPGFISLRSMVSAIPLRSLREHDCGASARTCGSHPGAHVPEQNPNRGARIRTGDLCDPNAALYRTEPRPEDLPAPIRRGCLQLRGMSSASLRRSHSPPSCSSTLSGRGGIRTHEGV
jgi:hypothetical protein